MDHDNELKMRLRRILRQRGGILPSCYSSENTNNEKTPFELEFEAKKQKVNAIINR